MVGFKTASFDDFRLLAVLDAHVSRAWAETAAGSTHAIAHNGLRSPEISLWTRWIGDMLTSVGALKWLAADHREVKSMFTVETARRSGAGSAMLRHLIETAKSDGVTRLSLETGSWPYFAAARAFYARHGFVECAPFGDYALDPNSVFMSLDFRQGYLLSRR